MYSIRIYLLPLFTRLSEDDVKTHVVRGRLYQIIISNPGIHFREIQREYGTEDIPKLQTGALCYHLDVLTKNGFVKSQSDGYKKRFYKRGMTVDKDFKLQILDVIVQYYNERSQGITAKELSETFDVSLRIIRYNVGKLSSRVASARRGKRSIYYPIGAIDI